MNKNKEPENKAYKVTLILLVGLAAFSTAMKDLNRLREMVSSVHGFTSQWHGVDLAALNDNAIPTPVSITSSCPKESPELVNSVAAAGAGDGIALRAGIEVESTDCGTITEPEVGGRVELIASRKTNRNLPQLARKYAPARTPGEEISAKRRDGHWPSHFEFRTNDRIVTLDLPMTMITDMKAEDLDTEILPDFPLSLLGRKNGKQSHGKIDSIRREIMIKRLERSFTSRRAS